MPRLFDLKSALTTRKSGPPVLSETTGTKRRQHLRIAQFTSTLIEPLGGAEQYCLALARHQKSLGHDVTVVAGWADDSVVEQLAADGIPVVLMPTSRPYCPDRPGPSLGAKLRFHSAELLDSMRRTHATRELERLAFDVLHVHRYAGFGTSVLRVVSSRVVHTVHDYTLVDTSASLVRDGKLLTRRSLVQRVRSTLAVRGLPHEITLVFPSARTRDRHDEWGFETSAFDSIVVPHGWPAAPAVAPRPTRAHDDVVVLFLGKLAGHKGIDMLLEAWNGGIPGARLRIAGDGPLASQVISDVSVEPLGWLDADGRASALADADALIVPSLWPENFPIVVAESMLAGVPVITTTVASPPLVDDRDSGLLAEPTAEGLRAAIETLVADRALLARLATGAALRAHQLDMDAHDDAIIGSYFFERSGQVAAGARH